MFWCQWPSWNNKFMVEGVTSAFMHDDPYSQIFVYEADKYMISNEPF